MTSGIADGSAAPGGPVTGSDTPFYTIGQVAELLDVPVAQLRRLDDLEVVQPGRSGGNQRRYSQNQIEQAREVIELADQGVTLAGVRRILELRRRVEKLEREVAELRAANRDAQTG